jgi:flagellar basal-body rod protein FlgB
MMLDKIAKEFSFQQRALDLQAYRAEVISSNIANADTPNYKAVDFDFAKALQAGIDGQQRLQLDRSDARHFAAEGDAGQGVNLQYRHAVQPSLDGNTVDMDVERGAFANNALQYESTLTFLSKQFSTLNTAITSGS